MKISVFIAASLDGYIARRDGALDWLPEDSEPHGYDEFIASIDAIVIGRMTWEIVLGFPEWPYGAKPVIVLSSTLTELRVPPGAVCDLLAGLIDRLIITRIAVLLGSGMVQSEYTAG